MQVWSANARVSLDPPALCATGAERSPRAPFAPRSFRSEVSRALRRLHAPERLTQSKLLELVLVERGAQDETLDARARFLVHLLRTTCAMFERSPRDAVVRRILEQTFLHSRVKQHVVAETLGLPFGTYRRYLTDGIDRLADALWASEQEERARTGVREPQPVRRVTWSSANERLAPIAFAREVRRALRVIDRPDLLRASPLSRSRAVLRASPSTLPTDRATCLQRLLVDACESLGRATPDDPQYLVLLHTYLRPAIKQLAAAGDLGMTYGTYRRHLSRATARVVHRLWEREQAAGNRAPD